MRACEALAAREGLAVVARFDDAAISGSAIMNRPGFKALWALAQAGGFDVLVAENTDRLTRAGAASWDIFYDLKALGIRILTVNQGKVEKIHVGLSGLMSELMIEEIAKKTRRGLEGVVRGGRSAGGIAYGYRAPIQHDAKGERVRGLREIDEARAEIVRRIFRDYAAGATPLAVADALNREAVAPPRGTHWMASTILGSAERGVGILRNEIYRGVRVWGRAVLVKNRETGKRTRLKGSGAIQRAEVPDLRIVDETLWQTVQRRLTASSVAVVGSGQRRPLRLFSGLIRCGVCGGVMTQAGSGDYLRCAARTNRGPSYCANGRHPKYSRIEETVLSGIETNLLQPAAIEEALKAARERLKAGARRAADTRGPKERELADAKRRAAHLIRQVEDGMPWSTVKDRHAELAAKITALEADLTAPVSADVVRLHTASARDYRAFVADLRGNLGQPGEARDAVRRLVEEVRFYPIAGKRRFELEISADLLPLLAANQDGVELMRANDTRS